VPNILVTGRGTSGSWKVRGEQLGTAIGATVLPRAVEFEPFDAVVLVKRPAPGQIEAIQRAGVPLIWDVVDAYPQPDGNRWTRPECLAWLRQQMALINPRAVVAATKAMAGDLAEFGVPVLALPHHARPGLMRNPIRPLSVIGYEGSVSYIGGWMSRIDAECKARRLAFHINPIRLADLDVVLALRDAGGYAPRNWKSNVKLANAQGSGTPVICCREAGYAETASGGELWADDAAELTRALDLLEHSSSRRELGDALFKGRPTLEATADTYRHWLDECATALKF